MEFRQHVAKGDGDLTTAAKELLTTRFPGIPNTGRGGFYIMGWKAKVVVGL